MRTLPKSFAFWFLWLMYVWVKLYIRPIFFSLNNHTYCTTYNVQRTTYNIIIMISSIHPSPKNTPMSKRNEEPHTGV